MFISPFLVVAWKGSIALGGNRIYFAIHVSDLSNQVIIFTCFQWVS